MGERLKVIWGRLRDIWPYLAGVVFLLAAGAALKNLPERAVPKEAYWLDPKTIFDMKNEARRTISYIIGGLLAVIGIILTFRRIRALERQVQIAQEEQITERFTRAIDQLGSDKMAVRLGGIYALERIANDSDKDYWTIMETLTAYVRENARWREPPSEAPAVRSKTTTDIQAILTVLGRRKYHYSQGENQPLDLRGTDLRGAILTRAHLEGAKLAKAHLERANLVGAHLEEAFLFKVDLKGSDLTQAHIEKAILNSAHLEGATISEANLEKAKLGGAFLTGAELSEAHLAEANFSRAQMEAVDFSNARMNGVKFIKANLRGADLQGAHLAGAIFFGALLEGANLWDATGLTSEQLAEAITDEKTILPIYLQEKPPEDKGPEGNQK